MRDNVLMQHHSFTRPIRRSFNTPKVYAGGFPFPYDLELDGVPALRGLIGAAVVCRKYSA